MLRWSVIVSLCAVVMAMSADEPACSDQCTCNADKGYVTCAGVSSIPAFINASAVVSLTLSPNTLTEISVDSFTSFMTLTTLDLSHGRIATISAGAFQPVLNTLNFLILKGNNLTSIPPNTFKNSSSLFHLDLSQNHLTSLQANSLVGLSKLAYLNLSSNDISHIDEGSFVDTAIETLHLGDNELEKASFLVLRKLKNLKHLFLENNKISSLRNITDHVDSDLEVLNLRGNLFHSALRFPEVSSRLVSLDLSFCNITDAMFSTRFFDNVPTLKTIDLSGNQFHTLFFREFHGLSNLSKLYLSSLPNLREIFGEAFQLENLELLDLSKNEKLFSIHKTAFEFAPNLTTLDLSYDALETIDEEWIPWHKMEAIRLEGNRFICNCSLLWVVEPLASGDLTRMRNLFDSLRCSSPPHLAGKKLVEQNAVTLDCVFINKQQVSPRVRTGLIAAALTVFVLSALVLALKCRKRIASAVRRQFRYRRFRNGMVYTVEHDTTVGELEERTDEDYPLQESQLDPVTL